MDTKGGPFSAADFGSFDVGKILESMKVPGVDWQALMDSQAKNIAALTEANQRTVQGLEAIAKRQLEILQQAMTEAAGAARQSMATGPREAMTKQTEAAKQVFEQAVANMRELADMMQKSNREAFDVVNKRISASLSELKDRMTQT